MRRGAASPDRDGTGRRIGKVAASDLFDGGGHASATAERPVGKRDEARIRRCGRRRLADRLRDREFAAAGIERAGGHVGARGRAADAGVAVHHQRCGAVPAAHELDQPADVLLGGMNVAVHRLDDVVHPEDQVIGRRAAVRPLDPVGILQQRDDVARTGAVDGSYRCASEQTWIIGIGPIVRLDIGSRSPGAKASIAGELGEPLQKPPLGDFGGPGREIVALDHGRQLGRPAEELLRLRAWKSPRAGSPRDRPRCGRPP